MMTGRAKTTTREQRSQQALKWAEDRDSANTLSTTRKREWNEWSSHPENMKLYRQYVATYARLRDITWPESSTEAELRADPTDLEGCTDPGSLKAWIGGAKTALGHLCRRELALAASVGVVALLGFQFLTPHSTPPLHAERTVQEQIYRTGPGERRDVSLSDGSVATLMGEAVLRAEFTSRARLITLDRGDMFVWVTHDPHRPFVVRAGTGSITAVGTRFSVRYQSAQIKIVVTEGAVEVRPVADHKTGTEQGAAIPPRSTGPIRVKKGEVITYRTDGSASQPQWAEPDQMLEPDQGLFIYRKRPLRQVVEDLKGYSSRPIVLDPRVADLPFSGSVNHKYLDQWLHSLPATRPVEVKETADAILILPPGATDPRNPGQ